MVINSAANTQHKKTASDSAFYGIIIIFLQLKNYRKHTSIKLIKIQQLEICNA